MQLDWHDLRTNGCPALFRALKQIETALTQQEQDILELQYLLSEELMVVLVPQAELRAIRNGRSCGEIGGKFPPNNKLAGLIPARMEQMACDSCVNLKRCKWLIGDRAGYAGDECDWIPSRYVPSGQQVDKADEAEVRILKASPDKR